MLGGGRFERVGGVEIRFPRGGWKVAKEGGKWICGLWDCVICRNSKPGVCGCGARKDRRFVARKAKSQESGVGSLLEAITVFMSA
jgi:hypothetical protein